MPSVAIHGKDHPLSVFLYIKEKEKQSSLKIYAIDNFQTPSKIELVSEEGLLKNKIGVFINNIVNILYGNMISPARAECNGVSAVVGSDLAAGFRIPQGR